MSAEPMFTEFMFHGNNGNTTWRYFKERFKEEIET